MSERPPASGLVILIAVVLVWVAVMQIAIGSDAWRAHSEEMDVMCHSVPIEHRPVICDRFVK